MNKLILLLFLCIIFSQTTFTQTNVYNALIKEGNNNYTKGNYIKAFELYVKAKEKAINEQQTQTADIEIKKSRNCIIKQQDDLKKALKNANEEKKKAIIETKKAQSLVIAAIAREQLDKDPTKAIRLAELAWKYSPTKLPNAAISRIIADAYYQSLLNNTSFYHRTVHHKSNVVCAVFSPDGKKIVTASWDNTAKIWDANSGKLVADLIGHGNWVVSAAFSNDGDKIVTASWDKTAKLWDANSGKLVAGLIGHGDYVNSAAFSPDGKKNVTASGDRIAKIWDANSGKLVAGLIGHSDRVISAAFSNDGDKIVTASWDKTAKIWDANSGKLVADLIGHGAKVISAAFSNDGDKIVTASSDRTAKIWLTPKGIIEWLKTTPIDKLSNEDFEELGLDFMIKEENK